MNLAKVGKQIPLVLCWGAIAVSGWPGIRAQAEPEPSHYRATALSQVPTQIIFEPPTDETAEDSRGGASRPAAVKCSGDETTEIPLTSLMPGSNRGLTARGHPTFFLYVPPTIAQKLYFSLKDENNKGIYQTILPGPGEAGIARVSLPEDQPPLEIGKTYTWSVGIMCEPIQTDMPWVQGQVRRVEFPLASSSRSSSATELEMAASYGKAGIWYDTLSVIAELRRSQPESSSVAEIWTNLLNSAGLEEIATEPLLE